MKHKPAFWALLSAMGAELALLLLCALFFLLALAAPLRFAGAEAVTITQEAALLRAYESGQLIRLHILADSDSPEAQRVKLLVRDALLAAFSEPLRQAGAQSADAVYEALLANAQAMEAVARRCARAQGFAGEVTAQAGRLFLPEKRYGQALLPAGEYRCLRVTLGAGAGQNWWCVLFPQLCLAIAGEAAPEPASPAQTDQSALSPTVAPVSLQGRELCWASASIWDKWLAVAPEPPSADSP